MNEPRGLRRNANPNANIPKKIVIPTETDEKADPIPVAVAAVAAEAVAAEAVAAVEEPLGEPIGIITRTNEAGVQRQINVQERFTGLLRRFLTDKYDDFCALLMSVGGLIAGGSILQAIDREGDDNIISGNNPETDVDIYIPCRHKKAFMEQFLTFIDIEHESSFLSSVYCESFLKKNGIKRVHLVHAVNDYPDGSFQRCKFDIMSVRNKRKPINVVNNFDLTFCQVWFDGTDVFASHGLDVETKTGSLQPEYFKAHRKHNKFILNRLEKYRDRGYDIVINDIESNNENNDKYDEYASKVEPSKFEKQNTESIHAHWSARIMLAWVYKQYNVYDNHSDSLPNGFAHNEVLCVPFGTRYMDFQKDMGLAYTDRVPIEPVLRNGPNVLAIEEYDSEDFEDDETIMEVHNKLYAAKANGGQYDDEELTMNYFRRMNRLLLQLMWPNRFTFTNENYKQKESVNFGLIMDSLFNTIQYPDVDADIKSKLRSFLKKREIYFNVLRDRCLRVGTCMMCTEDAQVYDFHEHSIDQGICSECLEGFLEGHMRERDKDRVPCYAFLTGRGVNATHSCGEFLRLSDVKYALSREFYKRYTKKIPDPTGLAHLFEAYDQTLQNERSEDDAGFGQLYHMAVCPFCLEFTNRDSGCIYMTHQKAANVDDDRAPYCNPKLHSAALFAKYRGLVNTPLVEPMLRPSAHIEFCIECGRPCLNHKHLTTSAPYQFEQQKYDANGLHDYGKCAGGGRAELFARVLAVRHVYKAAGTEKNKLATRHACALAADDAPNNAEYMRRGTAIAALEVSARKWSNSLERDPSYSGNEDANDYQVPQLSPLRVVEAPNADVEENEDEHDARIPLGARGEREWVLEDDDFGPDDRPDPHLLRHDEYRRDFAEYQRARAQAYNENNDEFRPWIHHENPRNQENNENNENNGANGNNRNNGNNLNGGSRKLKQTLKRIIKKGKHTRKA